MDNISYRNSNDTTTSMYLSFDAESTMSTACYKTLEALSDTSNLSIDMTDSTTGNKMNKTLEVHMDVQNMGSLETVKKRNELINGKLNTPLKALPKNILKEYKAVCSTPSKEHLLKTVDVTRGSDATRCVDLGLAFLGIDDDKPAMFPVPNIIAPEENKENVLPDIEEMSTLSTCSSVETITSIIEKKTCPMSTVDSVTEADSGNYLKITDDSHSQNSVPENPIKNLAETKIVEVEMATKINNGKFSSIENLEISKENNAPGEDVEFVEKAKPQIAILNRRARFSVCEPNLQTGKPSRIVHSNNNRRSLLPTCKKPMKNIDAEVEIPQLINKMLKITEKNEKTVVKTESKEKDASKISGTNRPVEKRPSLVPTVKTRTSLLTSAPNNKRPFSFTQRMSVVVKTTLNSPARKIARKSVVNSALQTTQRKNVTSTTIPKDNTKLKKESTLRKSLLTKPTDIKINNRPNLHSITSSEDTSTKTANASSQRKSLYPITKTLEKDKFSQRIPELSYVCNVCKEKFRIKSLLDAHKRSHETDNSPPAFIKKPSAVKQPLSCALLGNQNQCKYCDKKFALTKALHIHLLQNCPKIPPSEKRKLQYTDLNHVEKAQLPNVFPNHHLQSNAFTVATERHRYTINQNGSTKTSSESLNDKKDKITPDFKTNVNGNNSKATQTSAHKTKKISAHAGVYRTPSKTVPCHICKLTFKSILDYTNHNLASHGNSKAGAKTDTGIAVGNKQF